MKKQNEEHTEPIYLDQKGLEELKERIHLLEDKLKKINLDKKDVFADGVSDIWDSVEFSDIEVLESRTRTDLKSLYNQLSRVIVVERQEDNTLVDIGDELTIELIYSEDDIETLDIRLIGGEVNLESDIQEVSLNSPIGMAIYQKKIGDICTYKVNNIEFKILIKGKIESRPKKLVK